MGWNWKWKRKSLLLLDRYFLSVPALETLDKLSEQYGKLMYLLVKAKMSCVAYTKPTSPEKAGWGRPRKKGDTIKLKELFTSTEKSFEKTTLMLYGKKEEIKYLTLNLLWGKGLYKELRFVLVDFFPWYSTRTKRRAL